MYANVLIFFSKSYINNNFDTADKIIWLVYNEIQTAYFILESRYQWYGFMAIGYAYQLDSVVVQEALACFYWQLFCIGGMYLGMCWHNDNNNNNEVCIDTLSFIRS